MRTVPPTERLVNYNRILYAHICTTSPAASPRGNGANVMNFKLRQNRKMQKKLVLATKSMTRFDIACRILCAFFPVPFFFCRRNQFSQSMLCAVYALAVHDRRNCDLLLLRRNRFMQSIRVCTAFASEALSIAGWSTTCVCH